MWYLVLTLLTGVGVFPQSQLSVMWKCVLRYNAITPEEMALAFSVVSLGSMIRGLFIRENGEVAFNRDVVLGKSCRQS